MAQRGRNVLHESGGLLDEMWDLVTCGMSERALKEYDNYSCRIFYLLIEECNILQNIKISTINLLNKLKKLTRLLFVKNILPIKTI